MILMPEPAPQPPDRPSSTSEASSGPEPIRGYELILLGIILAGFLVLAWLSLVQKSVTVDEFAHLPAGLSYWRTRDFRIYPHGSPLIQMLAAAPIAASRAALPLELGWKNRDQWQLGYEFMYANADSYQTIFVRARAVVVVLGALLVALIWWWARALYGPKSGLAAASLAAFNPTLMAHSELVTTDVGVSLTMLAAVVSLWACCRRPSPARMAGAGVCLGLALLSKFTALLLLPLFPILTGAYLLAGGTGRSWRRAGAGLAVIFVVGWLTLCSGYLWQGFGTPVRDYTFQSRLFQRAAALLPAGLPVPLPRDCVQGLDVINTHNQQKYDGYLFGRLSTESRPYYYLVALAVKTPLAALVLLGLGAASLGWARKRSLKDDLFVWAPPLLFIAFISFWSNLNIGLRYLLPAFPYLFILAARPWSLRCFARRAARAGLYLLLAGNLAANLLSFPDYLAYFNLAAGGPDRGYRVLINSDLDWGQDLIGLQRYLEEQGISRICLAYFGRVDPNLYGIQYTVPLPGRRCELVAASLSLLWGPAYLLQDETRPVVTRPGQFAWLREQEPIARIGHSIWIFRPAQPIVPDLAPAP